MLRAHKQYQITDEEIANDSLLIKRRVDLIHSAASLLDKNGLIKYDKKSGNFMTSTLGKIASHYYIKHPSIATYNE
jgi:pre-mRNA-splicing helicase BRR2